jgi:CheY-like chemotaxis protein
MREIIKNQYDLLILDMSIPTFDGASKQKIYAGRDILHEIKRKNITIPTVVFTQYTIFGEGEDQKNADQLDEILAMNYPNNYLGIVYFSSAFLWQEKLGKIIRDVISGAKTVG